MRLLNTRTLDFKEFPTDTPPYIILSHRWSGEEVSYSDYVLTRRPLEQLPPYLQTEVSEIKQRHGYHKILEFAARARTEMVYRSKTCGIDEEVSAPRPAEWCWVDTCCIDKSSSAELSEAINSMWTWYRHSSACLVYLSDVIATHDLETNKANTSTSEWFERAWTLQEYLAPRKLTFFDRNWEPLLYIEKTGLSYLSGFARAQWTSGNGDARRYLAQLTKIPEIYVLRDVGDWLYDLHVANRMSWAAERSATRIEDMAYSLMGIFDINMPLLYGEGHKAFMRLQHEILRSGYDDSIFAWWNHCHHSPSAGCQWVNEGRTSSILASHPRFFSNVHGVNPTAERRSIATMSNVEADIDCLASFARTATDIVGQHSSSRTEKLEKVLVVRLLFQRSQLDKPDHRVNPCLVLATDTPSGNRTNKAGSITVSHRVAICSRELLGEETGHQLAIEDLISDSAAFEPTRLSVPIGVDRNHSSQPTLCFCLARRFKPFKKLAVGDSTRAIGWSPGLYTEDVSYSRDTAFPRRHVIGDFG